MCFQFLPANKLATQCNVRFWLCLLFDGDFCSFLNFTYQMQAICFATGILFSNIKLMLCKLLWKFCLQRWCETICFCTDNFGKCRQILQCVFNYLLVNKLAAQCNVRFLLCLLFDGDFCRFLNFTYQMQAICFATGILFSNIKLMLCKLLWKFYLQRWCETPILA